MADTVIYYKGKPIADLTKDELVDALTWAFQEIAHQRKRADRYLQAAAALAEPEPKGPTDEELEEEFGRALLKLPGDSMNATAVTFARAVLARWGNHPGSPDSSLQPVPVSERLPEPTDEPMIPDHYRGDDIRVYREGFHAGYKYAFQLIEKHSDV